MERHILIKGTSCSIPFSGSQGVPTLASPCKPRRLWSAACPSLDSDSLPLSKSDRVVITWSPSSYTPVGPDCYDALSSPGLLITTWQLVKAHVVTWNKPVKNFSLPYNLHITGRKIIRFMLFPGVLTSQTALFGIWTWIAESTDDSSYANEKFTSIMSYGFKIHKAYRLLLPSVIKCQIQLECDIKGIFRKNATIIEFKLFLKTKSVVPWKSQASWFPGIKCLRFALFIQVFHLHTMLHKQ